MRAKVRGSIGINASQPGQHSPLACGQSGSMGSEVGERVEKTKGGLLIPLSHPGLAKLIDQATGVHPCLTEELFELRVSARSSTSRRMAASLGSSSWRIWPVIRRI